jgi:hypothetical protein
MVQFSPTTVGVQHDADEAKIEINIPNNNSIALKMNAELLYEAWKSEPSTIHTHPSFESEKNNLLLYFCRDGVLEGVKWIIEQHNVDPALGLDKPLHIACRNLHYDVAKYLLKIPRVRKYAPANFNRSLFEAQKHKHEALIALLKSVPEIASAGPDMDKYAFGLRFDDEIAELPPFEPYVPIPTESVHVVQNHTIWDAIRNFFRGPFRL